jgi:hypothetical protein
MGRHWEGTSGPSWPSSSAQLSYSGIGFARISLQRPSSSASSCRLNPLPSKSKIRRTTPAAASSPSPPASDPIPWPQRWQSELIGFGARETEAAATVGGGPGGRAAACRVPLLPAPATRAAASEWRIGAAGGDVGGSSRFGPGTATAPSFSPTSLP